MSEPELGPRRSPTWACANPATPSIGERSFAEFIIEAGRFDGGLVGQIGLDGVIQFLLADGLGLCQRRVTLHIELGLAEFGHRLVQRGFVGAIVNLEELIAFFHKLALLVILLQQVAADLGGYRRVDLGFTPVNV